MPRGYSRPVLLFVVAAIVALALVAFPRPDASAATPIVVTEATNTGPNECNTGGNCNLWDAITYANTVLDPVITFDTSPQPAGMGTSIINIDSQLASVYVGSSVEIDGGSGISIVASGPVLTGLVFLTYNDVPMANITLRNLYVAGFTYDAIQFCPDYDFIGATCDGEVSNVVMETVEASLSGNNGILFLSPNIHDVRLTDVAVSTNGVQGIGFGFYADVPGSAVDEITLERIVANANGTDGVGFIAETVDDVTDTDSDYSNQDYGFRIRADQTFDVDVTRPTYLNNDSAGLYIDSGPTLAGLSVTGGSATDTRPSPAGQAIQIAGGITTDVTINGFDFTGMDTGIRMDAIAMHDITVEEVDGDSDFGPLHLNPNVGPSTDIIIRDNSLERASGTGATIVVGGEQVDLDRLEMTDNFTLGAGGIQVTVKTLNNATLSGNVMLGSGNGGNPGDFGVKITAYEGGVNNLISKNNVSDMSGDAIELSGGPTLRVTLSEVNSVNNGGLGVDLPPNDVNPNDAGDGDSGINTLLNFPEIEVITGDLVQGITCSLCDVQLYLADDDPTNHGEGGNFITRGFANFDGEFSISVCVDEVGAGSFAAGQEFTALATDDGNTSEFSLNVELLQDINCATPAPTPSPPTTASPTGSPSPTDLPDTYVLGDANCDRIVGTDDMLIVLGEPSGAEPLGGDSCVEEITADTDCDDDLDVQDALRILLFVADLPIDDVTACPDVGDPVPL